LLLLSLIKCLFPFLFQTPFEALWHETASGFHSAVVAPCVLPPYRDITTESPFQWTLLDIVNNSDNGLKYSL